MNECLRKVSSEQWLLSTTVHIWDKRRTMWELVRSRMPQEKEDDEPAEEEEEERRGQMF